MNLSNFLFKYKKFLLIAGFIAFILGVGYLIYFVFFYTPPRVPSEKEPSPTTTPAQFPKSEEEEKLSTTTPPEKIPEAEQKEEEEKIDEVARGGPTKTSKLNDDPALKPDLSPDGSEVRYYNQKNGKFYRINEEGEAELLSDRVFHEVEKINWSPAEDKAILEYPDGSNIIYDFESEKQISLPKHWQDFDFSSNGKEIVAESIGMDPDNRWLIVTDNKGGKRKAIEKIGEYDDTVYPEWSPNEQIIAMYTKGKDFNRQEVFFLGKNKENFSSTIVEGRDFRPKWSKKGDKLLYSVYSSNNDMKPKLWTVDAEPGKIGQNRKSLNINTWSDKCAFASNEEIYCGVPENLEEGSGLFPELAAQTQDKLYKINTQTGQKELIAVPDKEINISDLNVTPQKDKLFFKDNFSGNIHQIDLK